MKFAICIAFSAVLFAQETPAPAKEQIKMSAPAVAEIAKAKIKAMEAQRDLQQFADQLMKLPQYRALEKAANDASSKLNEIIEAERKAAKAENHDPDIDAGVWKKRVEAAKK